MKSAARLRMPSAEGVSAFGSASSARVTPGPVVKARAEAPQRMIKRRAIIFGEHFRAVMGQPFRAVSQAAFGYSGRGLIETWRRSPLETRPGRLGPIGRAYQRAPS